MRVRSRGPLLAVGAVPVSGYIVATLIVPALVLLVYSFWKAGFFTVEPDFTWENYGRVARETLYWRLLLKSLGIGFLAAVVAVPVAYVVAYAIVFRFRRWGTAVLAIVMLSMLSSYIVRIYAWKSILGPEGLVNQVLKSLGLIDEPLTFLLYGNVALLIALVNILIPFAVLPIYSALQNVDADVIAASRDLGSSTARTFRLVTLPLSMPGVSAAFLFCFILATSDYVTPQLVGGTQGLLIGRVIADQFGPSGNLPMGAALSVTMLVSFVIALPLLALIRGGIDWLGRRSIAWTRPRNWTTRRDGFFWRLTGRVNWLMLSTAVVLAFLYLPLAVVILFSFNKSSSGVLPIEGFSLGWYRQVLSSPAFLSAALNSLFVAALAVVIALALGVPAALALSGRDFSLKRFVELLLITPIALPGVVIGVAMLSALTSAGGGGGLLAVVSVHALFTVPFVVLVLRARMAELDWQLTEAARDLGSSRARAFRTVTLPLIAASLGGAGILVFALSLDEFVITNFVVGTDTTLPVLIWSQMRRGITPEVNAISTIILLASLLLVILAGIVLKARGHAARRSFGRTTESSPLPAPTELIRGPR